MYRIYNFYGPQVYNSETVTKFEDFDENDEIDRMVLKEWDGAIFYDAKDLEQPSTKGRSEFDDDFDYLVGFSEFLNYIAKKNIKKKQSKKPNPSPIENQN